MRTDDVANKSFSRVIYGYDTREVDAFLDEVIIQLDADGKEHDLMVKRIKALLDKLADYEE